MPLFRPWVCPSGWHRPAAHTVGKTDLSRQDGLPQAPVGSAGRAQVLAPLTHVSRGRPRGRCPGPTALFWISSLALWLALILSTSSPTNCSLNVLRWLYKTTKATYFIF